MIDFSRKDLKGWLILVALGQNFTLGLGIPAFSKTHYHIGFHGNCISPLMTGNFGGLTKQNKNICSAKLACTRPRFLFEELYTQHRLNCV